MASDVQVYPPLCRYCNGPHRSIDCQMENPFAQAQPPQLPQGENRSIEEMANAHAKFMDDAKQKVNESFLHGNLLSTIEENPQEEDLEVHENVTLRIEEEIEEVNEKEEAEEVDEELIEQMKNEDESTSLEPKEKNEEVETIPEMTPWTFVQEELPSEDIPYILEVEEPVVSWHEIKGTSIVDIVIKSFEEDVLKLLKGREGWGQESSSVP